MMISVVLAVFNEEKTLEQCLQSVVGFADEIVLVDGGSTDKTLEIAQRFHAKIIRTTNPPMFHINKQKAIDAAQGEWILALDADEVVSAALAKEIQNIARGAHINTPTPNLFLRHQQIIEARDGAVGTQDGEVVAYFVPRLNYFLKGWLRHGGVYPDGVIRLFQRGKAHFPCKNIHEQPVIQGKVGWLHHDLLHYADPTFQRYLMRANRYTSLTAEALLRDRIGTGPSVIFHYMFIKPVSVFLSLYLRHKGILDGFPGFVWALFSGLHYPIAFMKYWEKKHA